MRRNDSLVVAGIRNEKRIAAAPYNDMCNHEKNNKSIPRVKQIRLPYAPCPHKRLSEIAILLL